MIDAWISYLSQFQKLSLYDQYQIIEQIGTGKYSQIYLAIDKTKEDSAKLSKVALKIIKKNSLNVKEIQNIK